MARDHRKSLIRKVATHLSSIVIMIVVGVLTAKFTNIEQWEIWDAFVEREPTDIPVVLSPRLQYDVTGNHSARVRIALERAGIPYRTIERSFPDLPPIVPSGDIRTLAAEQGELLLDQHGGDLILYGSAGPTDGHVFLRLFVKNDCGCVHGATPFDLTEDKWESELELMIETVMTTALVSEYHDEDWVNSGIPLSQSMRRWERKFGKLAEMAADGIFEKETRGIAEQAKLARIKVEGDRSGIRDVRRQATERLSEGLAECRSDANRCGIRSEILLLADLEIYDGLMNGLPERLEEGLSLALLAGKESLTREVSDNPGVLQPPMQGEFKDWLSMAILVLACDDQHAMRRYEHHIDRFLSGTRATACFREGDVERILLPMAVLKDPHVSGDVLEEYHELFSQYPYFGWPHPDHWQDPFLHAKRSIQRRLQRVDPEHSNQLDSRFLGQPQCPSLLEWMDIKGWGDSSNEDQVEHRGAPPCPVFDAQQVDEDTTARRSAP